KILPLRARRNSRLNRVPARRVATAATTTTTVASKVIAQTTRAVAVRRSSGARYSGATVPPTTAAKPLATATIEALKAMVHTGGRPLAPNRGSSATSAPTTTAAGIWLVGRTYTSTIRQASWKSSRSTVDPTRMGSPRRWLTASTAAATAINSIGAVLAVDS